MFRESVPDGTGMLFVFPRAEIQGVWMKDTYVPLDVAFLDAQSRILSIEQLEPLDLTPKWSQGPVMFALEVRQGWFADHRISVGDRAEIVFGVRPPHGAATTFPVGPVDDHAGLARPELRQRGPFVMAITPKTK